MFCAERFYYLLTSHHQEKRFEKITEELEKPSQESE